MEQVFEKYCMTIDKAFKLWTRIYFSNIYIYCLNLIQAKLKLPLQSHEWGTIRRRCLELDPKQNKKTHTHAQKALSNWEGGNGGSGVLVFQVTTSTRLISFSMCIWGRRGADWNPKLGQGKANFPKTFGQASQCQSYPAKGISLSLSAPTPTFVFVLSPLNHLFFSLRSLFVCGCGCVCVSSMKTHGSAVHI